MQKAFVRTHNETLINLSKQIAFGDIQKTNETGKKLASLSKITKIGTAAGIIIGLVFLFLGVVGVIFGKTGLGAGSLSVGVVAVITNILNLNKQQ